MPSRTVKVFSAAAGLAGEYPLKSPTVKSARRVSGVKYPRATPVVPVAAGTSMRKVPSRRGASNSQPTHTTV